ncbi:MAG: hypothetical protein J3K34DRAFT_381451, partial [Monoraphidium minutum]
MDAAAAMAAPQQPPACDAAPQHEQPQHPPPPQQTPQAAPAAGSPGGGAPARRQGGPGDGGGKAGRAAFADDDADWTAYDDPLYATDSFRLNCFKILPCSKRYTHDWVRCPFAHPGEKARRRPPSSKAYSATMCPDVQRAGSCPRGDACSYAHNVFEHWLHHDRYRTQMCRDGPACCRKICFFAHSIQQLRTPAANAAACGAAAGACAPHPG